MIRGLFLAVVFIFPLTARTQTTESQTVQQTAPSASPSASPAPEASSAAPVETLPTAPVSDKIEKVEVTGSHIKRIDTEGASPVEVITRKELEKTGYNSVADVMRDTTTNSFGSAREASGSNAAGNAEVDLRGLGSSNTLVLLNGQRLPTDAVTGAVDLNLIPMAAVERIEVLKDGASAIYGSDALGGVVNIITRKDFNGTEVSLTESTPELKGGRKSEISVVNGLNRGKFNMVNVLQYRNNEVIYSRDRSWTNTGTSTFGSPGSYRNASDVWHADPNCPAAQIQHTPEGDFCSFRYPNYSTELPALQQLSFLSESNLELNSTVKLTARLGGTQKRVQWSFAPAPGQFTIPAAVAGTLGPGGGALPGTTPGQDLKVKYRLLDLGTRDTEITTNSYNLLLGATIQAPSDWQIDVTGSHNIVKSHDEGVNGYALTSILQSDIQSGAYNPFATGAKGSLNNARYNPLEETLSQLSNVEVKASGEVGKLPAGAIGVAVGSDFTIQKYEDNFDEKSVKKQVFGNAGSSGGGQRDIRSAYTELSIPVTKKLELQLAGRYDHYSDFGDTANPKAALLYHATPSLLLRSSVGTGFKAPLMQDLYAATTNGNPTFIDYVSCNREKQAGGDTPSCTPQQYPVTSSGNTGLREEKSISYNAGAVFEPSTDFNLGTDLFLTKLSNVVGIDFNDAMLAESQGVDLSKYGVIVNRDSKGYIDSIIAPQQNLSSQEVSGLDVSAMLRVHKFKFTTQHSQLFYFKEEGFPGTGLRDKLGEAGRPNWRNTTAVTFLPSDRQDLTLSALTTAGSGKSIKEDGKLPNYTEFDLAYSYRTQKIGTFSLGVRNLLGTTPPLDETNPTAQLGTTLYDQIGRQFIAGYKKTF